MATERFGRGLPRAADAPRIARGLLGSWTHASVEPDQLRTARLLVNELVSNAVIHGEGQITLCVWLRVDALRVEVCDQGAGFVVGDRRPPTLSTGGWGLYLVSTHASRWGVSDNCAGVWFEMDFDGVRNVGELAREGPRVSGHVIARPDLDSVAAGGANVQAAGGAAGRGI